VGKKHGPNKLSNYVETHTTVIRQFISEGFVLSEGLSLYPVGQGLLVISGEVRCLGGIVLNVAKVLEIVRNDPTNPVVQTAAYSYNAKLEGLGNIVRYDSPHDHHPRHHVHRFDVLNGDSDGALDDVKDDDWPTIGDLLGELRDFYYANFEELKDR
jgi:hypothetical protein